MALKTIDFLGRDFSIEGVSADDPYFAGLADRGDAGFARLIAFLLSETATALDIGANIGVTSCILSRHLSKGHVYAFEPSESVYPILSRNISTNKLTNVTARRIAVGDKPGTLGFTGHSAYGHLVSSESVENEGQVSAVDVETIDGLVGELGLEQVDFVKIDVEGFEDRVLAGGRDTEKQFSPLYFMEFNAFCIAAYRELNPLDLAKQILTDFEHVFLVSGDGSLHRIERGAVHLLHTNIVTERSVSNLLMTNSAARLGCQGAVPIDEFLGLKQRLRDAEAQRDAAISERDHAKRYPWKYLRSALSDRCAQPGASPVKRSGR